MSNSPPVDTTLDSTLDTTPEPPFDPPYFTAIPSGNGMRVVETRADGTTRELPDKMSHAVFLSGTDSVTGNRRQTSETASAPAVRPGTLTGDRRAALYLEVPFAEKDEAKKLGARWDAAKRKWYVPHGLDIKLFGKWWPDALKQDAKTTDLR